MNCDSDQTVAQTKHRPLLVLVAASFSFVLILIGILLLLMVGGIPLPHILVRIIDVTPFPVITGGVAVFTGWNNRRVLNPENANQGSITMFYVTNILLVLVFGVAAVLGTLLMRHEFWKSGILDGIIICAAAVLPFVGPSMLSLLAVRKIKSDPCAAQPSERQQSTRASNPFTRWVRTKYFSSAWQNMSVWLCVVMGIAVLGFVWLDGKKPARSQSRHVQLVAARQKDPQLYPAESKSEEKAMPLRKPESTVERLRRLAGHGDAEAQYELGLRHFYGMGVTQSFVEAVKLFTRSAGQSNAKGKYGLAWCFSQGLGIQRDERKSATLMLEAAQAGIPEAQYITGLNYKGGMGLPCDYLEAVSWVEKAAEQGQAAAQAELGTIYASGRGVSKDLRRAAELFRRAADQGNAKGQSYLGYYYWEGEGVPQNDIEAYKWFSLAAAQEDKLAAKTRELIAQQMSRAEIVEAQRRAAAFVAKPERMSAEAIGNERTPTLEDTAPSGEGAVSVGTGFFVTDDGYLVTCEHVVRDATSFQIKVPGHSAKATLIKKDRSMDVALLKVNVKCHALPVLPDPRLKLGDGVFTIGFPNPEVQGVQPKLTRGEISSMAGILDNPHHFQISVPVQPGNSGGALVDEKGNVVGVVTARLDEFKTYELSGSLPQNVNYAVKGNWVRTFLDGVPELSGKLKTPRTTRDRDAASTTAEHASVQVIAE